MIEKIKQMTLYNQIGIILNSIAAFLFSSGALICIYYGSKIEYYSSGLVNSTESIDPESITAGYELIASLFGGLGGLIIGVFLKIFGLILAICTIICLITIFLGYMWKKKYGTNNYSDSLGKGNQIAQTVLNSLFVIACIVILFDHFYWSVLAGLFYALAAVYTHIKCILIINN